MGAIDFQYIVAPRNVPLVTFQDTLVGAASFYIGANWDCEITFHATGMDGVSLDTALNTGAGGMTFGNTGLNLSNGFVQCFPNPVDNRTIIARSSAQGQYVQCVFRGKAGANNAIVGLGAMMSEGEVGYALLMQSLDAGTAQLIRYNGNFGAGVALDAALLTYIVNDILRMECRVVGTTVEIKSFKNGVLQKTTVDNSVNRLTSGRAGLFLLGANTVGSVTISDYNGGSL